MTAAEESASVHPKDNGWTSRREMVRAMRYATTRDGQDIGYISYLDGWLEPHLTKDWRGIFDVDDITTPEDRARLRQLIAESDEIRPGRLVRYEDDAEEVVHRRGEQAYWFEAFRWKLKEAGYLLSPAAADDDVA